MRGQHARWLSWSYLGLVQTAQELERTFYNRLSQKAVSDPRRSGNLIMEVRRQEAG